MKVSKEQVEQEVPQDSMIPVAKWVGIARKVIEDDVVHEDPVWNQ